MVRFSIDLHHDLDRHIKHDKQTIANHTNHIESVYVLCTLGGVTHVTEQGLANTL